MCVRVFAVLGGRLSDAAAVAAAAAVVPRDAAPSTAAAAAAAAAVVGVLGRTETTRANPKTQPINSYS